MIIENAKTGDVFWLRAVDSEGSNPAWHGIPIEIRDDIVNGSAVGPLGVRSIVRAYCLHGRPDGGNPEDVRLSIASLRYTKEQTELSRSEWERL